ncbi:MAG: CrcB family protein, partial [Bifidobacteriaceae bacterium]|nr:CrcB family protein [Bifidobacteriaceae bacterium]
MNWWLVALGGALGTLGRHGLGEFVAYPGAPAWPWATFAINLTGSLALGLVYGWTGRRLAQSTNMHDAARPARADPRRPAAQVGRLADARLFLGPGVLGGFTTYSAFSVEVLELLRAGALATGLGYALASALGGMALAAVG